MGVQWTPEQQAVIDSRDRNLLVAAAAGSGKTAVMVQHILELVADPVRPVPVTDLLVVTFTRAAAGEMKERLRSRLEERQREEPGNVHLRRQTALLDQAHICTIDSFCQWMVKNYFYRLDLDPDFRVPDEGEAKLIREEILDGFFEEGNEDYFRLMEDFGSGKGDRGVRELVESLYLFADSAPWPRRWLTDQLEQLDGSPRTLEDYDWSADLEKSIRESLTDARRVLAGAAQSSLSDPGLDRYHQMFLLDIREMDRCLGAETLSELLTVLGTVRFSRKPTIPKKLAVDEGLKARLSAVRDAVKESVKKLAAKFAVADVPLAVSRIAATAEDRRALLNLTLTFSDAYARAKRERNLADFADIEHRALDLLVEWRDGKPVPTPLAAELGDTFREILVDEYQDSNLVQETILRTLSGEDRGHPDMFMVGDVKQSIYKFRMARPELFMEKYRRFSYDPLPEGQKIDLSRNFRSRRQVLGAVNGLFSRIMGEGLGGVEYDEHAALHYGADYPEEQTGPETHSAAAGRGDPRAVELLAVERNGSGADAADLEGHLIARRIRELVDPESGLKIRDGERGTYRPAEYRDIVVLLRTMEGWADRLTAILNQEGIPAFAQLKKGYFAAREVQVLLNFLRILDNPLQDIPLASVLLSPIGGFSEEELALMTAGSGEGELFRRLARGAGRGQSTEKWTRFTALLGRYRREAAARPIHEVLEKILEETDYQLILAAEPGGKIRTANVEMLMERAMAYEETSYHGIFDFLRYMEKLQRYQVDYGEAQVLSENENLVRLTSIHRSKGLEYPVVFVAGMGKSFNFTDARSPVVIHEDLGLACDAVDAEAGLVHPTLWKKVVADRMERDVRGEELRILYVAMTRAKEKLILTGCCDTWESLESKWIAADILREEDGGQGKIPASLVNQASSFLDWLVMANPAGCGISVETAAADTLAAEEEDSLLSRERMREQWLRVAEGGEQDPGFARAFGDICGYSYPWTAVCHQKAALSVTELKRLNGEETENAGYEEEGGEPDARTGSPAAADGAGYLTPPSRGTAGAERGTAYHAVLRKIAPEQGRDEEGVARLLREMTESGELTGEAAESVKPADIARFFRSDLGRRMAAAGRRGQLHREQPFVMGRRLSEILPPEQAGSVPADEWVLVQGIVDAFLEEEDGLVLWDYKTDRVSRADGARTLIRRYRTQLLEYRKALERAAGRPVKEMWIYSFALGRAVPVTEEEGVHTEI